MIVSSQETLCFANKLRCVATDSENNEEIRNQAKEIALQLYDMTEKLIAKQKAYLKDED